MFPKNCKSQYTNPNGIYKNSKSFIEFARKTENLSFLIENWYTNTFYLSDKKAITSQN